MTDVEWEWALEAVLRKRLTTVPKLRSALGAPGRMDREAVARIRRVLALRPDGAAPTGSKLETLAVQLFRSLGLPDPVRQHEVDTNGFTCKLDLSWPELGIFVELDGEGHKGQPRYDARRQTAVIAATGWLCARFTWTEIVQNPTPTGRRLLLLFETAAARGR